MVLGAVMLSMNIDTEMKDGILNVTLVDVEGLAHPECDVNMNSKLILLILGVFIFVGCGREEKKSTVAVITVPECRKDKEIDLQEVLDTIVYVPLETTDACILDVNMVRRLEYYKGKFYLFIFTQGLFIFNSDGKFFGSIPFGRGPGELNMQNSHKAFFIDKGSERLVFPGWYKIHYYDLNGNFMSTTNLKSKLVPPQIAVENGQYWFYFFGNAVFNKNNDAFHFYRYDLEEGIKEGHIPANSLNKYGEGGFGFGSNDGILAYTPLCCDTIFRIKDGQFSAAYYVDFGKEKFPEGLSEEFRFDVRNRRSEYTGVINEVVTNDTILYFKFSRERVTQDAYYFINSGKILTGGIHKDKNYYLPVGHTLNYSDGYFLALANAYSMSAWSPLISQKLNLKEDDNPVIVLYKFKTNIK